MLAPVKDLDNRDRGEIELDSAVFGVPLRVDLVHRVVNWQLAKRRCGNHKTKGVSEVSGSGRKPGRQKGRGRARQGSLRQPQCRGGAVIFGPVVRDHAHLLPKKIRKSALKVALSSKLSGGQLLVLESVALSSHKTGSLVRQLQTLGVASPALVIAGTDSNFVRAARNIPRFDVLPVRGANVYDIVRHELLILSREAVHGLEERLR